MAEAALRNFTINFGAKHPGACLCLLLELDGEIAERVDPRIGLLHRGTKKLSKALPLLSTGSIASADEPRACVLRGGRETTWHYHSQARPAYPTANPARSP